MKIIKLSSDILCIIIVITSSNWLYFIEYIKPVSKGKYKHGLQKTDIIHSQATTTHQRVAGFILVDGADACPIELL